MATNKLARGLRQRYIDYRTVDQQRNGLIEELLDRLECLEEEYEIALLDKTRESEYSREGQRREQTLQADLRRYKAVMEHDPFVLVLIDGDGMIFDDTLLRQGEQGGREAAGYLWSAVREYVARALPDVSSPKIMTRVYANVKGLADACYKTGIVERPAVFEDFTRGFTGSKQLFDFVDVGMGKDRADDKLSEIFKLHLNDCHCRQVLLGCSHDNGYARLLEDLSGDPQTTEKITLLEGVPFEWELANLLHKNGYKATKFEGLFRSEKIVVSQQSATRTQQPQQMQTFGQYPQRCAVPAMAALPSMPGLTPVPSSQATENHVFSPPATPASTNNTSLARTSSNASSSPSASAVNPVPANVPPSSWAYAAKQGPVFAPTVNNQAQARQAPSTPVMSTQRPSQSNSKTAPATKPTAFSPEVRRNRHGQRIDLPIPIPPKEEINRIKKMKLCNQYMIRGECPSTPGTCYHDHSSKISKGEMTTLRYIARMAPCKMGTDCEDPGCTHGHKCPQSEEGKKDCYWKENCWFPTEMHGIDSNPVKLMKV